MPGNTNMLKQSIIKFKLQVLDWEDIQDLSPMWVIQIFYKYVFYALFLCGHYFV